MSRISWCKKQDKGIKVVEPNDNLSREYFENAEESLRILRAINAEGSNMWSATTKYYIEYFAVYSVLMKLGIKCEIHDCTLALVEFLEKEGIFTAGTAALIRKDKERRIDNQYYLKNSPVDVDFEMLSGFLISIRKILDGLDYDRIHDVRKKLKRLD